MKRPRISREQFLCIAAAGFLAILSTVVPSGGNLTDGHTLERSSPGGADREYELNVGGISDSDETISVRVSSREYTEEEARALFEALMEEIAVYVVGENDSLDHIDTDISFPKSIKGYEGVKLSWYPADSSLIDYEGRVENLGLDQAVQTSVRVVLKTGSYSEEYALPLTVVPAAETEAGLMESLNRLISELDSDQINENVLELPTSLGDLQLSYSEKQEHLTGRILLGGIFAAVIIGLRPEQERRRKEKLRENELLMDYSELISKLIVYMGAGLTVRNAWLRLSDSYETRVSAGQIGKRAAYEEMLITAAELKKGVPEMSAYAEFGRRCRQKCYMKLASILDQNVRNGDSRSEAQLRLEMQEAFEERKNIARRQGEEAGTKLMLPLMLSLAAVLIIVAAPAFISMS